MPPKTPRFITTRPPATANPIPDRRNPAFNFRTPAAITPHPAPSSTPTHAPHFTTPALAPPVPNIHIAAPHTPTPAPRLPHFSTQQAHSHSTPAPHLPHFSTQLQPPSTPQQQEDIDDPPFSSQPTPKRARLSISPTPASSPPTSPTSPTPHRTSHPNFTQVTQPPPPATPHLSTRLHSLRTPLPPTPRPPLFSPQKKKDSRYVPGGFAEALAGSVMSLSASRGSRGSETLEVLEEAAGGVVRGKDGLVLLVGKTGAVGRWVRVLWPWWKVEDVRVCVFWEVVEGPEVEVEEGGEVWEGA